MSRRGARTTIVVYCLLAAIASPAGAQTFGRPIEETRAIGAIATTPASNERPVLAAIDGQESTSWSAAEGAALAGAVIVLPAPRLIAGLRVSGRLSAESRLTVEWLDTLENKPFFGGTLSGPFSGESVLDLSLERVVTDRLLVTIAGPSVPLDCVSELVPLTFAGSPSQRYLPPTDVVPGEGTSTMYAAEWLADGDVRTAWRAGSLGNGSPSEMLAVLGEDEAGAFRLAARRAAGVPPVKTVDPISRWHPEDLHPEGAIFEYDEGVSLERVKIFYSEGARGSTEVQVETPAGWQTVAWVPPAAEFEGWVVSDLASPVSGSRFKLVMSHPVGNAGDITELELWGTRPDHPPLVVPGEFMPTSMDDEVLFRLLPPEKRPHALELIAADSSRAAINGQLNGLAVSLSRASVAGNLALYRADINTADFDADELWLCIPDADSLALLSCRLRTVDRSGEFFAGAGTSVADGSLIRPEGEAGTTQWHLDRELAIDAVEVRGPASASAMVRVLAEGAWTSLVPSSSLPSLAVFPCDRTIAGLELTTAGELSEVTLQGSPTADVPPSIRIILPAGEMAARKAVLLGTVYDPATDVTVNSLAPRRIGPFFWMGLDVADPHAEAQYHVVVRAADKAGRTATLERRWYQWGQAPLTVDQAALLQFTNAPSFDITGKTVEQLYAVEANGTPVPVSGNTFSVPVPVSIGFNTIVVTAKRKTTGTVEAARLVHVIRQNAGFGIEMTSPVPGSIIATAMTPVGGRLIGAVSPVTVSVNGVAAVVTGSTFTTTAPLSLTEGHNTLLVSARDGLGTEASAAFRVTVDTVPPVISFVLPAEGFLSNASTVSLAVRATDANTLTVAIDGALTQGVEGLYQVTMGYADGTKHVLASAVDAAGNTSTAARTFMVDTTPPEAFAVVVEPSGWTDNPFPVLTFGTTDATSGIARYEVSIDAGPGVAAASPFTVGPLPDGVHSLEVTAFDRAGNTQTVGAAARIDTVAPPAPACFRGIEGPDQVELVWELPADDVVSYLIDRTPAWDDGQRVVTGLSCLDSGLAAGTSYEYSIVAVDRAGHRSPPATDSSIVGVARTTVEETQPGEVVEFQNLKLYFPEESIPEGTREIAVTTVTSDALEQEAVFGTVSPLYDFTVTVEDASGVHQQEGVEFSADFIGIIRYDPAELPEGFPEENIGLYYWDTTWSRWFRVDKCAVDVEQNLVAFATSHFTLFSVQPTMVQDLSPLELSDVGWSPFKARVTQGGITVSTQGGSAMTEATDMVLPGKAGFDFVLKRTWDTATARGDSPGLSINAALSFSFKSIVENADDLANLVNADSLEAILRQVGGSVLSQLQSKITSIFKNYGDYAYSTGVGWRLNFPYLRTGGGGVLVRTTSGAFYAVNNMDLKENELLSLVPTTKRKLLLENHEGEDFTLEVQQALTATILVGSPPRPVLSWWMENAVLIMKDGSRCEFDSLGRVTSMEDGSGMNRITFAYGGTLNYFLDTITDSMGRVLKVEYDVPDSQDSFSVIPRIKVITLQGDPQGGKVVYGYKDRTLDDGHNPGVPLLGSVTDAVGRTWIYGYDRTPLLEGGVAIKVNFVQLIVEALGLGWLSRLGNYLPPMLTISGHLSTEIAYTLGSAEGPGIGYTRVRTAKKTLTYVDLELTDYLFGFIPTGLQGSLEFPARLFTSSVEEHVSSTGPPLKTTKFQYDFHYAGHHQVANRQTVVDDGRTVTTHVYKEQSKQRKTYLTVADWAMVAAQGIIMDPFLRVEIVPLESSFTVQSPGGPTIETTSLGYDPASLRMTSRAVSRGAEHSSSTSWNYDGWGNVVESLEQSTDESNGTERRTTASYFVKPVIGTFPNLPPIGSPYGLPPVIRPRMDMALSQRIDYSVPAVSGSSSTESTQQFFDYDSLGRRIAETALVGGKSLETRFEYDGHSELIRVTSPAVQGGTRVTSISRDYEPSRFSIVNTVRQGVELAEGAAADLATVVWYDRFSGLKRYERDARGYLSAYAYDAIGRLTETVKPADDDPLNADPLAGVSFLDDNPTTTVAYDDAAFDVTVRGARGQHEVYDFDQAGRLMAVDKTVRKLDADGVPVESDPQAQTTTVGYDGWGNLTSMVDPNGHRTDYTYDLMGRLSGIVYPADSGARPEKKIVFDYSTNTQTTTDERGFVSLEYYDMAGRKTGTLAYPDEPGAVGRCVRTSTSYDGMGRVSIAIDELGGVTTTRYDERGNPIDIRPPSATFFEEGSERTYSPQTLIAYDDGGAKLSETFVTRVGSYETRYRNNSLGQVLSMERTYTDHTDGVATYAIAREIYTLDESGNRLSVVDANDGARPKAEWKAKATVYSARGKVLSETDRAGNRTTYAYDADDNPVLMTDPRGNDAGYSGNYRAEFWYDDVSRLVKAFIPSAEGGNSVATVSFVYDPRGNLLKRADADGSVITFTYSARNKPLSERKSDLGETTAILIERTYDQSALEIENLVGGLYRTTMSYDGFGRIIQTMLPSGSYEKLGYDAAGNRSRVEDGNGHATAYAFDSYKRLLVETDALNNMRQLSYDARGNLTREIDANGNVRLMSYDELGRLITEQRADGATCLWACDAVGNLSWSCDSAGVETRYVYTDEYLVEQVVKSDGVRTQARTFSWDRAGNRKSASNESVTTQYNLSTEDVYTSDPYGRVRTQRTTIGGETFSITWNYDEAGRVKQVGYPSGKAQSYLFDGIGLLAEVQGWTESGSLRRDSGGRLSGCTLSNGVELEQDWNGDGRLEQLGYRGAVGRGQLPSYHFIYDRAGDMTAKGSNTYGYDELRRLVYADEVDWTEQKRDEEAGAAVEDYTGQGELVFCSGEVELKLDRASTSIGAELGTERDLVGVELHPAENGHRVQARTVEVWARSGSSFQKVSGARVTVAADGTLKVAFDEPVITSAVKLHCLYDERDESDLARDLAEFKNEDSKLVVVRYRLRRQQQNYRYDNKGNRVEVTRTFADAAGSTTVRSTVTCWPSSDRVKSCGGWTYVYDAKGRLVEKGTEYTEGSGFAASSGQYAKYEWDLFDRLEVVRRSEAGIAGAVEVARYGYDVDGLRVQKIVPGVSGSVVTRWVYGPDGNPVVEQSEACVREFVYAESKLLGYWQTVDGEAKKYYTLTDQVGSVVSTTDELGVVVSKRDYVAFGGEAGVEGELATPALYTGKELDEEIGLYYFNARWYDPELGRFISEDPIMDGPNWYAYVANSPLTHTDPTGLGPWDKLVENAVELGREAKKEAKALFSEVKNALFPPQRTAQEVKDTVKAVADQNVSVPPVYTCVKVFREAGDELGMDMSPFAGLNANAINEKLNEMSQSDPYVINVSAEEAQRAANAGEIVFASREKYTGKKDLTAHPGHIAFVVADPMRSTDTITNSGPLVAGGGLTIEQMGRTITNASWQFSYQNSGIEPDFFTYRKRKQ